MKKLEVSNLTKQFGEEVAVDDFSMSIEEGTLKSLLGPSGCGKTTTLRCIAGLEKPNSGEIYINDELVSAPDQGVHVRPERRGIGMVFQNYAIWPHMTVRENVRFPLDQLGIGAKADRNGMVEDMLELVGLGDHMDDLAPNLSGGQQQRVALARALVGEPEILLLDEPLSNLDAKLREVMRHEIRRICDELGVTMLYVTHSQDEALFLSDVVAIMNDGHLVEEGYPDEIHVNPRSYFGMTFLGKCNVIPGTVGSVSDGRATIDSDIGAIQSTSADDLAEGQDAFACFRPKHVRLYADRSEVEDADAVTIFEGDLDLAATTTDYYEYYLDVGNTTIEARSPDRFGLDVGGGIVAAVETANVKSFDQSRDFGESYAEGVSTARTIETET